VAERIQGFENNLEEEELGLGKNSVEHMELVVLETACRELVVEDKLDPEEDSSMDSVSSSG
jgi:hypothetical protein